MRIIQGRKLAARKRVIGPTMSVDYTCDVRRMMRAYKRACDATILGKGNLDEIWKSDVDRDVLKRYGWQANGPSVRGERCGFNLGMVSDHADHLRRRRAAGWLQGGRSA